MTEKDIYKDFNNINPDEHEFDDINVSMTDIQKNRLKNNMKNKIKTRKFSKSKIGATVAAAAVIFFIGIGYANPSFAAQVPILNPIIELLGKTGDYSTYSEMVNQTVTCNGQSFTIDNVVCYDNTIIIGYTLRSNTKLEGAGPLFFPTFKVNGTDLHQGYTGGAKNIDDNTAIGTMELLSCDAIILPDEFKFDISFDKIDDTVGNWDFKFNVSKSNVSEGTKIYNVNQDVTYDKSKVTITKVVSTPLNTTISLHSETELSSNFIVLDDKGDELIGGSGSIKGRPNDWNSITSYAEINGDTKYLTLIPFVKHDDKDNIIQNPVGESVPINTQLPCDLSEGKNSKVTLRKISYSNDNDHVTIQGIIYGKLPNYQTVVLQGDNPKAEIRRKIPIIKKIDLDKYEFTEEYTGLKNDVNYRIIAPVLDYNIDYDSRITVMLK